MYQAVREAQAIAEIFQQHPTAPTAHFQDATLIQGIEPESAQGLERHALTLLRHEKMSCVEERVDVAARQTALAVGVFSAQAVEVGL